MSTNPQQLKPKTKKKGISPLFLVGIALFLALSASLSIWHYLKQTQEQVKKLSATRTVVIAAKEIMANTELMAEDLTTMLFPEQAVPADYPDKPELVIGRIVKSTVQPNEVISEDKLVKTGAAGGLANLIPPGHRAISIKVTEVSGVSGFISPGDRIDILSDFQDRGSTRSLLRSKTVLQNVLVLATGNKLFDPTVVSESSQNVVSNLTIALMPEDAEKLNLALSNGEIRLALRPHGEDAMYEGPGVTSDDVYGLIALADPALQTVQSIDQPEMEEGFLPLPPKNRIDIILGSYRTSIAY